MSTYDFSTLYTTLSHNLVKDKLIDLIERIFQREGSQNVACNNRNAFFTSEQPKISCMVFQNLCDAQFLYYFTLSCIDKLLGFRWMLISAPLVADLFLFLL